jgi:hypothetical protein
VTFPSDSDVVVKQLDETNWELRSILRYQGKVDSFEVPVGQNTDFASVPRPFVWFLPRYGAYTKAAILHDYLWRELAAKGKIDWVDADGLFLRAMRELRVPFLRRWIMWTAVRWAALFKPRGRIGWWRESWRVILATLVALPIVLPPAILVVVAWAAFFVLELLAWLLIEAGSRARAVVQKDRPRKEIVLPRLDLMTQGAAPVVTTPAAPEGSRTGKR